MASALVKRDPIKAETKIVSTSKLLNLRPVEDKGKSEKSSGVDSVDSVLDSIDSSISNLKKTLKGIVRSDKKKQDINRKEDDRQRKKKRESILEKGTKFLGALSSKVPKPFKGIWDTLKQFFGNIIIGSLVLFILKNWEMVVLQIKKVLDKIKELWKIAEPFALKILEGLKWIGTEGVKWVAKLMGVPTAENNTVLENIKGAMKQLPTLIANLMLSFNELKIWHEGFRTQMARFNPLNYAGQFFSALKDVASPNLFRSEVERLRNKSAGAVNNYRLFKKANPTSPLTYDEWAARELGMTLEEYKSGDNPEKSKKSSNSQPLGSGVVEKMFPEDQRIESQKGSDALNQFFGHGDQSSIQRSNTVASLNVLASYEKNGGTTNVFMKKESSPQGSSGGSSDGAIMVPLLNNSEELTTNLILYELSTTA